MVKMYWLKALIEERGINSLYFLSKETGIAESTFSTMIKNDTDYKDVKFGNMLLIAKAAEYELDEFVEWLEDFTKINATEKNRLQLREELVELGDVTIYLNENTGDVWKKYHQNTSLAGKEIEYVLSDSQIVELKEYADRYNNSGDTALVDDAEYYILDRILGNE
ncbi:TPA_asm: hypothetical protein GHP92_14750 [Listeria monocytogenes]|nr:helix-turn-helix transcriptional regulator [Listeria monocytogenes]HAA8345008.1 hypothetical protein [Listeria monocytogenes]